MIPEEILLPELDLGDWLNFPDMGAYAAVLATDFNGFPRPNRHYVAERKIKNLIQE